MLETNTESDVQYVLTYDQVATLNAARTVLDDLRRRLPYSRSGGMIEATAEVAEHQVFMVLNRINAHGVQALTDAQLYNVRKS